MISKFELSNALADCLNKIHVGATVDEALADYPHLANQLRELLTTAQDAQFGGKSLRVPAATQVDSQRRMLAQAQELKKRDAANPFLPLLRLFSRNAGAIFFSMSAISLLFIALGSTRALPGDSLYPVKLAAEQAGASISVGSSERSREENFDRRRMSEINQMIQQRRVGSVQFAGYLEYKTGIGWAISGIPLNLPISTEQQANQLLSTYVDVSGFLDSTGAMNVEMIQPRLVTIRGTLINIQESTWQVQDENVQIGKISRLTGTPQLGDQVVIQAVRIRGSGDYLAITIKMDGQDNLQTTEPRETTPTELATITPSPNPTRPPVIATPEPEDNPDEPRATPDNEDEDDDGEDDSHKNGEDDSEKDP